MGVPPLLAKETGVISTLILLSLVTVSSDVGGVTGVTGLSARV